MNTNNTGNRVSGEPRMGMVSDEVDERIYDKDLAHAWALKKMGYDADLKEISRIQQSDMLGRESVYSQTVNPFKDDWMPSQGETSQWLKNNPRPASSSH